MVTIVSPMALHLTEYDVYVFVGDEQKVLEKANRDNFSQVVMNLYRMYNGDKIILQGNDLLTYYFDKKIREENQKYYGYNNLNIERMK